VYSLLREVRGRASELRTRVDAHNEGAKAPPGQAKRVIFYVGQTIREDEA
jgi:hypothetical protein